MNISSLEEDFRKILLNYVLNIRIPIREKYIKSNDTKLKEYTLIANEYFEYELWAKSEKLVCPEFYSTAVDRDVGKLFENSENFPEMSNSFRISLHAAHSGSVTPLHFDWDLSEITHTNLMGERTVWIGAPDIPPLLPIVGNSALIDFESFPDTKRRDLLLWAGMRPVKLSPGDFIKFPSYYWHAVEYGTASLAISFRRELDKSLRPIQALPRSWKLQSCVDTILKQPEQIYRDHATELLRKFIADSSSSESSDFLSKEVQTIIGEDVENINNPWIGPCHKNPMVSGLHDKIVDIISTDVTSEYVELTRAWMFDESDAQLHLSRDEQILLIRDYLNR